MGMRFVTTIMNTGFLGFVRAVNRLAYVRCPALCSDCDVALAEGQWDPQDQHRVYELIRIQSHEK